MSKKAVITILGTIGCGRDRETKEWVLNIKPEKRAEYNSKLDFIKLSRDDKKYTNTLPLLIEAFGCDYDIIIPHKNQTTFDKS